MKLMCESCCVRETRTAYLVSFSVCECDTNDLTPTQSAVWLMWKNVVTTNNSDSGQNISNWFLVFFYSPRFKRVLKEEEEEEKNRCWNVMCVSETVQAMITMAHLYLILPVCACVRTIVRLKIKILCASQLRDRLASCIDCFVRNIAISFEYHFFFFSILIVSNTPFCIYLTIGSNLINSIPFHFECLIISAVFQCDVNSIILWNRKIKTGEEEKRNICIRKWFDCDREYLGVSVFISILFHVERSQIHKSFWGTNPVLFLVHSIHFEFRSTHLWVHALFSRSLWMPDDLMYVSCYIFCYFQLVLCMASFWILVIQYGHSMLCVAYAWKKKMKYLDLDGWYCCAAKWTASKKKSNTPRQTHTHKTTYWFERFTHCGNIA